MAVESVRCRDGVEEQIALVVEDRLKAVLHEIRQPLSAVFALAEAARSLPDVSVHVLECLDNIIGQAQEVAGAAWSVVSPQGSGGGQDSSRVVDLDEVVDSVVASVRLTSGATLVRRGDRGGWLRVGGSREELRRCLIDVVDNAARAAGPAGTVVVSLRRGPDTVRILVEDDGPGFGRVPSGTGLGLALTREVLANMGGVLSIGLPSRTGGAAVALTLPAQITSPAADAAAVRAG
jgi:signal transduction histidine kinase